jgi:hypothetical protein
MWYVLERDQQETRAASFPRGCQCGRGAIKRTHFSERKKRREAQGAYFASLREVPPFTFLDASLFADPVLETTVAGYVTGFSGGRAAFA